MPIRMDRPGWYHTSRQASQRRRCTELLPLLWEEELVIEAG
jgi:hypothetical protein